MLALFFFFKGNLVNISAKCHQRTGQRGEAVISGSGCPPRPSPGVQRWTSCVPETQQSQQAAMVEEMVVRVEDLCRCHTEQGEIA